MMGLLRGKRFLWWGGFFLILSLGIFTALGAYILNAPGPRSRAVQLYFPKGASLSSIGKDLTTHGIVSNPYGVMFFAVFLGHYRHLKWGEYRFTPHMSLYDVLTMLGAGRCVDRRLMIPAGATVQDVKAALDRAVGLQGVVTVNGPAGQIWPETYAYRYGETKDAVLGRMMAAATKAHKTLWPYDAPTRDGLTFSDVLVLASLVEKETAIPAERPLIARVFLNRLKNHMPLQSCVTVLYAKNQDRPTALWDLTLTAQDLKMDSPYNTYRHPGLPPQPICHPSQASILAVLNPAPSDNLFFIANGKGGHDFSKTFANHQKHHQRLRQLRQNRLKDANLQNGAKDHRKGVVR